MPALELNRYIEDFSADCLQIGVSPDCQFMAMAKASQPSVVSLCDLTGKVFLELKGHVGPIRAIDFSSDGRFLASSSADGTVRIWRPTGGLESVFDRFDSPPELVAFSPQVPIIATAEQEGLIVLFDIEGNYIATLHSPKKNIRSLSWSSDNGFLMASCADKNLYLYDITEQRKKVYIHPDEVLGAVFPENDESDMRCVLTLCADGRLRKIPSGGSGSKTIARVESPVAGLGFLRSISVFIMADTTGTVSVYDLDGKELSSLNARFAAVRLIPSPAHSRLAFLAGKSALAVYTVSVPGPVAP